MMKKTCSRGSRNCLAKVPMHLSILLLMVMLPVPVLVLVPPCR